MDGWVEERGDCRSERANRLLSSSPVPFSTCIPVGVMAFLRQHGVACFNTVVACRVVDSLTILNGLALQELKDFGKYNSSRVSGEKQNTR